MAESNCCSMLAPESKTQHAQSSSCSGGIRNNEQRDSCRVLRSARAAHGSGCLGQMSNRVLSLDEEVIVQWTSL